APMKNQLLVQNLRKEIMAANAVLITTARAATAIIRIDVLTDLKDPAMAIHYQKMAAINPVQQFN
ncbi:hypothetical protein OFB80_33835, partial [Escherichia coli]|nr:hypothetical protein [Escherichia coli]